MNVQDFQNVKLQVSNELYKTIVLNATILQIATVQDNRASINHQRLKAGRQQQLLLLLLISTVINHQRLKGGRNVEFHRFLQFRQA